MRLTAQTIAEAPTFYNAEGQLTLQLRSQRIPMIENLGVTQDRYAAIDLTNNDITEFSGVPESLRKLETLLLANNSISVVGEVRNDALRSLVLTNNSIEAFGEVSRLRGLSGLQTLSLLGNPVCEHENYREMMAWLFPCLKVLDFHKLTTKERKAAEERFGAHFEAPTAAAVALLGAQGRPETVSKEERQLGQTLSKLGAEEKERLLAQLETTTSLEEIESIEKALREGYVEENGKS